MSRQRRSQSENTEPPRLQSTSPGDRLLPSGTVHEPRAAERNADTRLPTGGPQALTSPTRGPHGDSTGTARTSFAAHSPSGGGGGGGMSAPVPSSPMFRFSSLSPMLEKATGVMEGIGGDRQLGSIAVLCVTVFIVAWGVYVLQTIVAPLVFATFLAYLLEPLQHLLEQEMSLDCLCCWHKRIRMSRRTGTGYGDATLDAGFYKQMSDRSSLVKRIQTDSDLSPIGRPLDVDVGIGTTRLLDRDHLSRAGPSTDLSQSQFRLSRASVIPKRRDQPQNMTKRCRDRSIRLPHWAAVFLTMLIAMGVIAFLAWVVVVQVSEIVKLGPQLLQQFNLIQNTSYVYASELLNIDLRDIKAEAQSGESALQLAALGFISLTVFEFLWNASMVILFVIFLLYATERRQELSSLQLHQKIVKLELEERTLGNNIYHAVQSYILLKSAISAALGLMVTLILKLVGVPGSVLFGMITTLANFVPMIGAIASTFVPLPLLILDPYIGGKQEDGIEGTINERLISGVVAMALPIFVHGVVGNLIEPAVFGNKLELHPVVILVMVLLGQLAWGLAGMILFVPVMAVIRIILSTSDHRFATAALNLIVKGQFSF